MPSNYTAINSKNALTKEYVLELLEYQDGDLYWKVSKTGSVKAGRKAGTMRSNGYVVIRIDSVPYLAHRIVWLMHYGWIPKVIDHINGNPSDNRVENLREATQSQNLFNKKMPSNNTSGVKGVNWDKSSQSWKVMICVKGKYIYLGRYKNIDDAAAIILMHRNHLHGTFARHE